MKGKVKFYNFKNHFGFIVGEDDKEYFVHKSQIEGRISDGDSVEFTPGENEKGPRAENVKKVEGGAPASSGAPDLASVAEGTDETPKVDESDDDLDSEEDSEDEDDDSEEDSDEEKKSK